MQTNDKDQYPRLYSTKNSTHTHVSWGTVKLPSELVPLISPDYFSDTNSFMEHPHRQKMANDTGGRKDTLVVNLFGGPGVGKSTGAAKVFSDLKMNGFSCELITEYAKDKVWEGSKKALDNQAHVFGQQSFRQSRCMGEVDVLVTDSPILLSVLYRQGDTSLTDSFDQMVLHAFMSQNNLNFLINTVKQYSPKGRLQTSAEAAEIHRQVKGILDKYGISYIGVDGNEAGYEEITRSVMHTLLPATDNTDVELFSDFMRKRGYSFFCERDFGGTYEFFGVNDKENKGELIWNLFSCKRLPTVPARYNFPFLMLMYDPSQCCGDFFACTKLLRDIREAARYFIGTQRG